MGVAPKMLSMIKLKFSHPCTHKQHKVHSVVLENKELIKLSGKFLREIGKNFVI